MHLHWTSPLGAKGTGKKPRNDYSSDMKISQLTVLE